MKKIKLLMLLVSIAFFSIKAHAQAPQTMTYQSVLRNSSNALMATTTVGTKISIVQGTANGTLVYVETQTTTTNSNGLLSLQIGAGTPVIGTFSAIDWSNGPYFIKTETDPTGGSSYTIIGTQQLASVPYALYAAKSGGNVFEPIFNMPNAIHNTNAGNVGIGTDLPSEKLDVVGNLRVRQNEIVDGNSMVQGNSTTGSLGVSGSANINGNLGVFSSANINGNLSVSGSTSINALIIPSGNPAQGKVLTSDNNGAATWQTPAAAGASGSVDAWSRIGNAGTVEGTNFIGTTDNTPFTIRVNNQKAGRIDVSLAGNTFFGYQSGNSNSGNNNNTGIGQSALFSNTTGTNNTATGFNALYSNTTGGYNTASGVGALQNNTTGASNTASGGNALYSNTTGTNNTASGRFALNSNTTGASNTASGFASLSSNTEGNQNTASG